jgi:hypothetical protein
LPDIIQRGLHAHAGKATGTKKGQEKMGKGKREKFD